ncbi:hypothetical protein AVEN_4620-1 [Araneus ventricosus]|uniref:Uncharacterized protein n=1 Tax=Araneus ventricosus TaxID=182803 RepID=A0A4Y2KZR6_ARAVE|nr:hypothetical protein AVEN_4620-1 [Araneus ventricosus]
MLHLSCRSIHRPLDDNRCNTETGVLVVLPARARSSRCMYILFLEERNTTRTIIVTPGEVTPRGVEGTQLHTITTPTKEARTRLFIGRLLVIELAVPFPLGDSNPDLALFGPLKQHLGGKHFADDDDVQHEVLLWMRQQPNEFHAAGIGALIKRWDKCINIGGDYD